MQPELPSCHLCLLLHVTPPSTTENHLFNSVIFAAPLSNFGWQLVRSLLSLLLARLKKSPHPSALLVGVIVGLWTLSWHPSWTGGSGCCTQCATSPALSWEEWWLPKIGQPWLFGCSLGHGLSYKQSPPFRLFQPGTCYKVQVFFGRTELPVCADHGIIPPQVQGSTLLLVEPCEVSLGPVKFHKVHLGWGSTICLFNLTSSVDLRGLQLCWYQDCCWGVEHYGSLCWRLGCSSCACVKIVFRMLGIMDLCVDVWAASCIETGWGRQNSSTQWLSTVNSVASAHCLHLLGFWSTEPTTAVGKMGMLWLGGGGPTVLIPARACAGCCGGVTTISVIPKARQRCSSSGGQLVEESSCFKTCSLLYFAQQINCGMLLNE